MSTTSDHLLGASAPVEVAQQVSHLVSHLVGHLVLAAPTGAEFKDWVLVIAGNIFIIVFVGRALGFYAKREWGEFFLHIFGGIIVAGFVYANNTTINILKDLWGIFAGTN
jgi:hypothetical protein